MSKYSYSLSYTFKRFIIFPLFYISALPLYASNQISGSGDAPASSLTILDDLKLNEPTDEPAPVEKEASPKVKDSPARAAVAKKKRIVKTSSEKISEMAQLRMDVADLMKKVNELEGHKNPVEIDKKTPTISEAVQKEVDKKVTSGNDKIKLTVSGQVNRAITYLNNGQNNRLKHVDNENSPSRFRFAGEGRLNECASIGALMEISAKENSTADAEINNTENATASTNRIASRVVEAYFKHTHLGQLFLGLGSTASDDTTEQDLSGTYVANEASGIQDAAGGVAFVDKQINAKSSITLGKAWIPMDGNSRKNRIRYDTPQIFGLVLGASHTSSDSWDLGAKFKGDFSGYKIAGGLGYVKEHAADKAGFNQLSGSISLLTPIGLNGTFIAGSRNFKASGRKTAKYWLARLGYKANPFDIGDLALAVDYGQQRNAVNETTSPNRYGNGSLLRSYGLSVVQTIEKIATEAYITVRRYDLSRVTHFRNGTSGNPSFKPIWLTMAGARIKF